MLTRSPIHIKPLNTPISALHLSENSISISEKKNNFFFRKLVDVGPYLTKNNVVNETKPSSNPIDWFASYISSNRQNQLYTLENYFNDTKFKNQLSNKSEFWCVWF